MSLNSAPIVVFLNRTISCINLGEGKRKNHIVAIIAMKKAWNSYILLKLFENTTYGQI